MPVIGGVILLLQISVIIHAMKTGRPYYWIFVIMAFPVIGCLIYFVVELLPGQGSHVNRPRPAVLAGERDCRLGP